MKGKRVYRPRIIDRVMFGILSGLHVAGGCYLVGPWYLPITSGIESPLYSIFNHLGPIRVFGVLLLLNALGLAYATFGKGRHYTGILLVSLFSAFLIRFYTLMGTFISIESWRPPTYLSNIGLVLIFGAYWVWVKVDARTIQ